MTIEEAAEILEEIKHIMPPENTDSTVKMKGATDNG